VKEFAQGFFSNANAFEIAISFQSHVNQCSKNNVPKITKNEIKKKDSTM
jgi:competence transcription factor ComK